MKKADEYWHREADKFAGHYVPAKQSWLARFVSRFLDRRTEILSSLAQFKKDAHILDLGCGSGVHVRRFAPHCRRIVGIDYSARMIEIAEKELAGLKPRNWEFIQGDAAEIPFPNESFDGVISMGLLDYVKSVSEVLAECARVLKPGAPLIFTVPKSPSLFALLRTAPGNFIRKKLFALPPIDNVLDARELRGAVKTSGLRLEGLQSVWTTMWIGKAVKPAN